MINSRVSSNLLATRIAADIIQKQNALAQTQEQISSGKAINRPSDDPTQVARLLSIKEATNQLDQYQRNASTVESQLTLEENALSGVSNALNRIRELALSSNNGVVDNYSREAVASEMRLRLDELYGLANARDSFGNYLFSGTNTQTAPFAAETPVNYLGKDDVQELTIGLRRKIQSSDSGMDIFMRVRNGNGMFSVELDPANTGTGTISGGSVVDTTLYNSTPYRLEFTNATTFDILNDKTGAMIQAGNAFTEGKTIEFDGIQTSISNSPAAGDKFRILPSANQDIFSTVSNFITALESSPSTPADNAKMRQSVDEAINKLDSDLDHINTARARVGTRLNSLDSAREENANVKLQLERTMAEMEDIDITEAITSLQTQVTSLDILQKAYTRIESMTLFNYL